MTKQAEMLKEILGHKRTSGGSSEIMFSELKQTAERFMIVELFRAERNSDGVTVEIKGEFTDKGSKFR